MTRRAGGGHRHHARSFREGEVFDCTGDGGQLAAIKQAIKQSSKTALNHRGTRENDRVDGEATTLALRARVRPNTARSATTYLLRGLNGSPFFLCDKNTCLITFLIP